MIPILGTSHASIMILSPTRTRTGGSRRGFDEAAIARGRWPSGHRPRALRSTGRQRQGKRKGSGGGAQMHEGDRSTRSSRPPQVVVSESPTGPPEQSVFGYGAALTFQVESVETENASTPSRRRVGDPQPQRHPIPRMRHQPAPPRIRRHLHLECPRSRNQPVRTREREPVRRRRQHDRRSGEIVVPPVTSTSIRPGPGTVTENVTVPFRRPRIVKTW